ncbi:hypothetical protein [Pseudomonas helmanticensis]|uniref:hypothetical protein n=1 Tax=Pseudomonas helmanticensis TaxID=1471381 RepID=UPI003817496E
MAKSNADRSAKAAAKWKERGEVEIRLHCPPGTRQALAELMAWSGIEEQGEAITLMIHHLHGLGPGGALPLLTPPRHEITVSPSVARKLERFHIGRKRRSPEEMFGNDQEDSEVSMLPLASHADRQVLWHR